MREVFEYVSFIGLLLTAGYLAFFGRIAMQWFFSGVGLICLLTAGYLALLTRTDEHRSGPPSNPNAVTVTKVEREHPANWAAAEGFALAGGLCFIASALVHRAERLEDSMPKRRSDGTAQPLEHGFQEIKGV